MVKQHVGTPWVTTLTAPATSSFFDSNIWAHGTGGNVICHDGRAGFLRNVSRGTGDDDAWRSLLMIDNNAVFYYIHLKFHAQ